MKLSPVDHLVDGILVLVLKGSNAKKRKLHGTLKIVYQVYHSKQDSKKKKIKVFNLLSTILCFPEQNWKELKFSIRKTLLEAG
jgi:hypothetical protein